MKAISRRLYSALRIVAAIALLAGATVGFSSCTSMEGDSTSSSSPREGS